MVHLAVVAHQLLVFACGFVLEQSVVFLLVHLVIALVFEYPAMFTGAGIFTSSFYFLRNITIVYSNKGRGMDNCPYRLHIV
jgi:hypothetical protein